MKILVMGSGALGGYFGGMLARSGQEVTFFARGAHLQAIQAHGLRVENTDDVFTVRATATDRPLEVEKPDFVLFTVKTYDTLPACEALIPILGPQTSILTLQNGVNSRENIEAVLGRGKVIPGLAYVESTIASPGVVRQLGGPRKIVLGESDGSRSNRLLRITEALGGARIPIEVSEDIRRELWQKFLFICALAGVTCVTRLTLGEILESAETKWAFEETIRETYRAGLADGVKLDGAAVQRTLEVSSRMNREMKSSMQRDLEMGRRLEIDALNGTVVRLAAKYRVEAPVNRCIYAFVKPHDLLAMRTHRANAA